jgi:hypothetical protein
MVLRWTNRGAAPKVAPKPAVAHSPATTSVAAPPKTEVAYDGKPMKAAKEVFKSYGKHVFVGNLADYYLKKNGGSGKMLDDSSWVTDRPKADIMAAAILEW